MSEPELLLEPREGVPAVVEDEIALKSAIAALRAGDGPVAIDVERASGYRYRPRAYLLQLRRVGAGTTLIDPIACSELTDLADAIAGEEWILHAARQDLPSLADLGLHPTRLFDTELAARLAGYDRVGLGPLVEATLGFALQKGHAAVDWSARPLPEPWLRYAALDVELLIELRTALHVELERQGKLGWAEQEFAALVTAEPPAPRPDPWRRTSGIHRVHTPRQLATVRALWHARDDIARERDIAPGRVLSDTAIIDAAIAAPTSRAALRRLASYRGPALQHLDVWLAAVQSAVEMEDADLPTRQRVEPGGGPPTGRWMARNRDAADRLTRLRAALAERGGALDVPVENLCPPDVVRRLAWEPPEHADRDTVAATMRAFGARSWQVEQVADAVAAALGGTEAEPTG